MTTLPVLLRYIGCALLLIAVTPAIAQTSERDRIDAFLKVTGFDVALESIEIPVSHVPSMLGMEAREFASGWETLAERIFDKALIYQMATEMLIESLPDDLLTHAASFYASDLGQRLVEVENESHLHPDSALKRREGEELILSYGTGPGSRTELLEELLTAVDGGDQAVRAVQDLQFQFLMAASNAGVLSYRIDARALRALLRANENDLREELRESALYGAAFTYKTIEDADLRAYRDALRKPMMQKVYDLMNALQHEITVNRYVALADQLAPFVGGEEL